MLVRQQAALTVVVTMNMERTFNLQCGCIRRGDNNIQRLCAFKDSMRPPATKVTLCCHRQHCTQPHIQLAHFQICSYCDGEPLWPKTVQAFLCCSPQRQKSKESDWPTIGTQANAHAVLASSCASKSATSRSAAIANTVDSSTSTWAALAYAHAVLAMS